MLAPSGENLTVHTCGATFLVALVLLLFSALIMMDQSQSIGEYWQKTCLASLGRRHDVSHFKESSHANK